MAGRASAVTTSATNWTLEGWIKPASLPQNAIAVYNGIANANGYGLGIGSATAGTPGSDLVAWLGSTPVDSGVALLAGQWSYAVVSDDSSGLHFWVNGVLKSSPAGTPTTPGSAFAVGAGENVAGNPVDPFNGSIDEVAAYSQGLAAGRIQSHYQEGAEVTTGFGTWTTVNTAGPPARSYAATAYDANHSQVVLFGGVGGSGALADTWTWNGSSWTQASPATSPSARYGARMAWDASTGNVVLFGGYNSSVDLGDTWTWNGTNWALAATGGPPPRSDAVLSFDAASNQLVLFGGQAAGHALPDTWSWNGTVWTPLALPLAPAARWGAASAYDPAHHQVLIFGGYDGASYLSDTWSWNGSAWSALPASTVPSGRAWAAGDYDQSSSTFVISGGYDGSTARSDTWTFDGSNWAQQSPATAAASTQGASGTYDAASGAGYVLEFGGTPAGTQTYGWAVPPGAPVLSAPVRGNNQVTVSWTAPATGGSPVTGYTVVSSPGGYTAAAGASATNATVTGLTNGTTYAFEVYATSAIGNGSPAISAPIAPGAPPGAPTGVLATAQSNGQAGVSWTAPSNGGLTITQYNLTCSPACFGAGGLTVSGSPAAIATTVTGLTNGTSYSFTVTATNVAGTGPASIASTPVTPATAPGAPSNVTATGGNASATVSWTAPNDGGGTISQYTVACSPSCSGGSGLTVTGSPAGTTTVVSNLADGTSYTFTVAATNWAGIGPASAASNSVTPMTVPGAPTAVAATFGNAQATVNWVAPATNGGSAITQYSVTCSPACPSAGGLTLSGSPPATSTTVTGLINGTTYTFVVSATNAVGTGPGSGASNPVTPGTLPAAPSNVSVSPNGSGGASVSWTVPDNGGSAVTGYTVTPYIGSSPQTPTTVGAPASSVNISGLTDGATYTFQVYATNSVGNGPAGTSSSQIICGTPGSPSGVSATAGVNGTATVTWTAPTSTGGCPLTEFVVLPYIGSQAETAATFSGTAGSGVVTGLTNGSSYTFTGTAVNADYWSAASTASNAVTPYTMPGAPTAATASPDDSGSAIVTWSAPSFNGGSAITGYTVTPYVGATAKTPVTVGGSTLSATINGLSNSTNYTFQVYATNAAGNGSVDTTSATTVCASSIGAATNVTAVAGSGSATVSWTAPSSTGGCPLTTYYVFAYLYPGTSGIADVQVGGAATSATLTGLGNGAQYDFALTADNVDYAGPFSAMSNVVTPSLPTITRLAPNSGPTAGGTQITISGTHFVIGATSVSFTSGSTVLTGTNVNVTSSSQLTVTSPAAAGPGVYQVTVQTTQGTSTTSNITQYDYISGGTVTSFNSVRFCDTRGGTNTPCSGHTLAANTPFTVTVTGVTPFPSSGVSAAIFNLTVLNQATSGWILAYPTGMPSPGDYPGVPGSSTNLSSSTIDFGGSGSPLAANLIEVPIGTGGQITLYANAQTDILLDAEGYVQTAGQGPTGLLNPVTPARICDTRPSFGTCQGKTTPLTGSTSMNLTVAGYGGIPSSGAGAAVINVDAIDHSGSGYVEVWQAGTTQPNPGSELQFPAGGSVTDRILVPLSASGQISIYTTYTTDLLVEVEGWVAGSTGTSGSLSQPMMATRSCDTRAGSGSWCQGMSVPAQGTGMFPLTGEDGVPVGATAVSVNLTVIDDTSNGLLIAYPDGVARPNTTDQYFNNTTESTLLMVIQVGANGKVDIYNSSSSSIDLLFDVEGYESAPGSLTSPTDQSRTQAYATLSASALSSYPYADYRWREITSSAFQQIPQTDVTASGGSSNPTWPVSVSSTWSWNLAQTVRNSGGGDGMVQVQACFFSSQTQSSPTACTGPSNVQLESNAFGASHATESVGPGSVALLTGDYHISSIDASVPSVTGTLSVGRTLSTGDPLGLTRDMLAPNLHDAETLTGWSTCDAALSLATSPTILGAHSLQITPNGGSGPCTPPVSDTFASVGGDGGGGMQLGMLPGRNYTFTTYEYVPSATGLTPDFTQRGERPVVFYTLNGSNQEFDGPAPTATNTWQLLTMTFTIPDGATQAWIRLYDGFNQTSATKPVYYDDSTLFKNSVFGPEWSSDLPGPPAGDADVTIVDHTSDGGYVLLQAPGGDEYAYLTNSVSSSYPISYTGISDAHDGSVLTKTSATAFQMTDTDGTVTSWTSPDSGATWRVSSVVEPGTSTTTSYTFDGDGRVTQIVGPAPTGVTGCGSAPLTTVGCRTLTFSYASSTTSPPTGTSWGNYPGLLQSVSFTAANPAGGSMTTTPVVDYEYDGNAMLRASWDPRLSTPLMSGYGYDSTGRLTSLTPPVANLSSPALNSFTFGYDSSGRLSTVSRTDPNGGTDTQTLVYNVPVTSWGAPIDLGSATTSGWGETSDLPTYAAAVFPASHVPAGTTPSTVASSDWPYATLHYLDVNGREVNTATYGAGAWQVGTTSYDTYGNALWQLSPLGRDEALSPASYTDLDSSVAAVSTSAGRAALLSTANT